MQAQGAFPNTFQYLKSVPCTVQRDHQSIERGLLIHILDTSEHFVDIVSALEFHWRLMARPVNKWTLQWTKALALSRCCGVSSAGSGQLLEL